jgi:hypothetical protein
MVISLMDEYLALRLARERMAEMEREWRRTGFDRPTSDGLGLGWIVAAVRRTLQVRDLGRLAIVSFMVMLLGLGVVGLLTAATHPPSTRIRVDVR